MTATRIALVLLACAQLGVSPRAQEPGSVPLPGASQLPIAGQLPGASQVPGEAPAPEAGEDAGAGEAAEDTGAVPAPVELRDEAGFLRAGPGRPIVLPADHGSHPETRTEWWYLTGPLVGPDGERFGFQATWFRQALLYELPERTSPMAVRDVLLYHGVLADMRTGERRFTEQGSRAYPGWAHAAVDRLDVAVFAQTLRDTGDTGDTSDTSDAGDPRDTVGADGAGGADGPGRAARLDMTAGDWSLELTLDLAGCAALLHGAEPGLSVKGSAAGEASWYYSLPSVPVLGELRRPGLPALPVAGHAWLDHEFGSSQLAAGQEGWDWFSVVLEDGSALMLYQMRRRGGEPDSTSAGTWRDADGTRRHLAQRDFSVTTTGTWTSPDSATTYPAAWTLSIPSAALELRVSPVLADQELETPGTTGVTYWEGLCRFEGTRAGRPVRGEGYVELVGYGEPISERFLGGIEASGARP